MSCGNKTDTKTEVVKQNPTVTAVITEREYFVGEKLKDINISLVQGSTPGEIKWSNENYELVLGENQCAWTFTPTDKSAYNPKAGSITITARNPYIEPVITNVRLKAGDVAYLDAKYSTVEVQCDCEVDGTIAWKYPNRTFVLGNNNCEWVFTPTDTETYSIKTGTLAVNVTEEQTLTNVELVSNSKGSGYVAFDSFDCTGLTVKLTYNAGKIMDGVMGIAESCSVTYLSGDCLHAGDTSVTVTYQGFDFVVPIEAVSKIEVPVPVFDDDITYDGTAKELAVEENALYQFTPLNETDAGEYNLQVTLTDSSNYKWETTNEASIIVVCEIQKAEQNVVKNEFSGNYDGLAHSSTITSTHATDIRYSETELNENNYTTAGTTPIEYTNAGTYTVYYYAVGDGNHNDAAGTITVTIERAMSVMLLQECYSVETGSAISYPTSYILVNGENVSTNLVFTYYTSYDAEHPDTAIKTTTSNGASMAGAAPANSSLTPYYVLVEFAGNQNFGPVTAVTELFIDSTNNGFYATSGDEFAFKDDAYVYSFGPDGMYTIPGSTQQCNFYLKFEVQETNADGLKEVFYISRIGTTESTGKLVYKNGSYQLKDDDSGEYLQITKNASNIVFEYESANKTLTKWNLPKYLGKFSAQTVTQENYSEEHNTGYNTDIVIYNDHGTIRFIMNYNVKCVVGYGDIVSGGGGTWQGVVEVGTTTIVQAGDHYGYNFKLMLFEYDTNGDDYRVDGTQSCCEIYWQVPQSGTPTETPTLPDLKEGDNPAYLDGYGMEDLKVRYTFVAE